jgi:hypothetical protein
VGDQFHGSVAIDNSAHSLCVFITGQNISEDGRKSGAYESFKGANLLNKGATTGTVTINGIALSYTDDYVIDAFGTPIVYDELKNDTAIPTGLNKNSFVMISGGPNNKDNGTNLIHIETAGAIGMFANIPLTDVKKIDTLRADYLNAIPPTTSSSNDDIMNR